VAVYSVNRQQNWRIGSGKSIENIEVYLKESGFEIAPKKYQFAFFDKRGQPVESGKSRYKGKRYLGQNKYIFSSALEV
jgi:hypothetical protein